MEIEPSAQSSFQEYPEKLQHNAVLVVTCTIKGTSELKTYEELGLESLKCRRWLRPLCVFYKI